LYARLQKGGAAEFAGVAIGLKVAVRGHTAGVHHALGDALVVEVGDFFAEQEVFQQRRAALAGLQRVLVVVDAQSLVRSQELAVAVVGVLGEVLNFGVAHGVFVGFFSYGFFTHGSGGWLGLVPPAERGFIVVVSHL
jgi:hypothetical protein